LVEFDGGGEEGEVEEVGVEERFWVGGEGRGQWRRSCLGAWRFDGTKVWGAKGQGCEGEANASVLAREAVSSIVVSTDILRSLLLLVMLLHDGVVHILVESVMSGTLLLRLYYLW